MKGIVAGVTSAARHPGDCRERQDIACRPSSDIGHSLPDAQRSIPRPQAHLLEDRMSLAEAAGLHG